MSALSSYRPTASNRRRNKGWQATFDCLEDRQLLSFSIVNINPTIFGRASDFLASINRGNGSTTAGTIVALGTNGFQVQGSYTYTAPPANPVSVTVTDAGSLWNFTPAGGVPVTIQDHAGATTVPSPIASTANIADALLNPLGATITADEGTALPVGTILATFTDNNPYAVATDFTTAPGSVVVNWGDGSVPQTLAAANITASGSPEGVIFSITATHTYAEAGTYAYTVTVTDDGGASTVISGSAIVRDAHLISRNGATITADEGTALPVGTILATFTDNNPYAVATDFTAAPGSVVVNWGDGSGPQTLAAANITASGSPEGVIFSTTATHTYAEAGTYAYFVTVTDDGGASTFISASAIVADAPLSTPATQPTVSTTEAPIFPLPQFALPVFKGPVASFTDANPTAPVSDFTATIDWGDGTAQSAGTISQAGGAGTAFFVSGAHTYADSGVNGGAGAYPITVYVVDSHGAKVTVSNTAVVNDVPMLLTGQLNPLSDSGKFNNDAITNVNRPNFYGVTEPFAHVRLFANGVQVGQAQAASDGSWTITSTRLADGSYTITATAIDQFGKTTTAAPFTIVPNLVIDTVGPRITAADFNRQTETVTFSFQDVLQDGATPGGSGLHVQSLSDAANYSLNQLHGRPADTFIVTSIDVTPGATPASDDVTVVFNNGAPINGGYFQIIARAESALFPSGIQDLAGNALDGEFYGSFPSGNGVPGGDFIAKASGSSKLTRQP